MPVGLRWIDDDKTILQYTLTDWNWREFLSARSLGTSWQRSESRYREDDMIDLVVDIRDGEFLPRDNPFQTDDSLWGENDESEDEGSTSKRSNRKQSAAASKKQTVSKKIERSKRRYMNAIPDEITDEQDEIMPLRSIVVIGSEKQAGIILNLFKAAYEWDDVLITNTPDEAIAYIIADNIGDNNTCDYAGTPTVMPSEMKAISSIT